MKSCSCFGKRLEHLGSGSCLFNWACSFRSTGFLILHSYHYVLVFMKSLPMQLLYFLSVSFLGFWVLKVLNPETHSLGPKSLDLFFTSVSATTVSSMSTVEMELFSNAQLVTLTILMFIGGEVFISMVGLHYLWGFKLTRIPKTTQEKFESTLAKNPTNSPNQIELGMVTTTLDNDSEKSEAEVELSQSNLKYKSVKLLSLVVLGYLLVIHLGGVTFLFMYLNLVSSTARDILKNKRINLLTFSIFTVVSTFANCGFVPTNENMIVFRKNSGLLLILIPQVLLGNTLFPPCLRFSIWVLGTFTKKVESSFLLMKNPREIGYPHLLSSLHSFLLVLTVVGFVFVQFLLFCSLEWNSEGLSGLSCLQKVVGVLFLTVNSRHAGETTVDLSTISPAILVLFVVMMYLPPYTSFLPVKYDEKCERKWKGWGKGFESLIFSQLAYLVIFIILICITERKNMKEDPLNFSVLNIVVEVISAYGSVGFSTGYSCDRQLKPDSSCKNKWYGFSGKWSNEGKIILILVMFFGRLKKFNKDGGQAWKLL